MDQGMIVEQGTADELLSNPKEERTRAFLSAVLS
jgi:polar amino acid transport system ATP-binding protein